MKNLKPGEYTPEEPKKQMSVYLYEYQVEWLRTLDKPNDFLRWFLYTWEACAEYAEEKRQEKNDE